MWRWQGRADGEHVLYSDRVRIENAKFSNTFMSVKSDEGNTGMSCFVAKCKRGTRPDKESEHNHHLTIDIPHGALTQSSVQASSDYRCLTCTVGITLHQVTLCASRVWCACTHVDSATFVCWPHE